MQLSDDQRTEIETAIIDAQIACEKYLKKATAVQFKLLELGAMNAIEVLERYKEMLQQDPKRDNYKLHMIAPLQTYYMGQAYNKKVTKKG